MKYVAAYLLLVLGGNNSPSEADLTKVLEAGKVEVDKSAVSKLVAELKGKDVYEVIEQGKAKLTSVPVSSGPRSAPSGGSSSGGSSSGGAAAASSSSAPAEDKKPESDAEESEGVSFFFNQMEIRYKLLNKFIGYGIWSFRLKTSIFFNKCANKKFVVIKKLV